VQKDFSQAPKQNDWQEFKPLFRGGKIKICDTLRAVTPFGGLFRSSRNNVEPTLSTFTRIASLNLITPRRNR